MWFYYNKKTKQISSWSEKKNVVDEESVKITPTSEELEKLYSNLYDIFYNSDKLVFVLNDRGAEGNKKIEMKEIISKIKQGTQTKQELADLLTKIIDK